MRPLFLAVCWVLIPGLLWIVLSTVTLAQTSGTAAVSPLIPIVSGLGLVVACSGIAFWLLSRQQAAQSRVEAAFSETERRYQLLFKQNPLPVWAYDRETLRFLEVNDVALAKYGYTLDELLALKVTDLHPPDEVPQLLQAIARPREVRAFSGNWRHRRKDGGIIDVEVQVHDLELRGRPARVVVALDVTERRRELAEIASIAAENARLVQEGLDRERRFRALVEGLDAIVWEADPTDLRLTFVGRPTRAILGYAPARWTTTDDPLAGCVVPEDRATVREYLAAVAAGAEALPCEIRARAADGRTSWLRIEGAAQTDADGYVTHLSGLITDVTDEHDQAERAARGEKLRALGQLSSGVAHDLNQSLALITGYGELLREALHEEPIPAERVREMADVMVRAASDGGETVRRMLNFVQTPSDEAAVPVDLAEVIQEVAQLTAARWRDASQAEGRSIDLTVEIEGEVVILGTAAALREVLTNLVLNAIDAVPAGGAIGLSAVARGDRAIVTVADNGSGMSVEVRERIFEPFFTTKGDRGTGLGLPTVFGIVKAHGGDLTVTSEPGQGSRFELSFPLPAAASRQSAPPPTRDAKVEPERTDRLRCLVVDDEPQLARMLGAMLERLGHTAQTATSGEEALAQLAGIEIDVLVTDVGMGPSMNGWELSERVLQLRPGLPIVLATGWGASIDPVAARSRGIVGILSKPYRQADLERVLHGVDAYLAGGEAGPAAVSSQVS